MAVALALSCVQAVRAQDGGKAHFHFAGPMSRFMADGATPGVSTSGIAFAVTLTDGGKALSTGPSAEKPGLRRDDRVDFRRDEVRRQAGGDGEDRNQTNAVIEACGST
jgi:hypothetical protein